MFNSWGLVNAYGTWSSYYVGHSLEGTDQLQLNLIGSTQSFLVLLFSNPVGRLLDANYSRAVIGFGAIFVPFGLFMLSVVHPTNATVKSNGNFGLIWAMQGLIVGLGMAPFFVSSSQGKIYTITALCSPLIFISRFHVVPQASGARCRLCRLWRQCCRCHISHHASVPDPSPWVQQRCALCSGTYHHHMPLLVHILHSKPPT